MQIHLGETSTAPIGTSLVPHFNGVERRAWANAFDLVSLNPQDKPNALEEVLCWILCELFSHPWRATKELVLRCWFSCLRYLDRLHVEKSRGKDPSWEDILEEEQVRADEFRKERIVSRLGGVIYNAFAASIPGFCVLGLYHLHNLLYRIYLLIALAVVFAIIVKVMGPSKDVEIFSVSAA
jgi:hypothetical protein